MIMPFGKFQGRPCHEVPRYYLLWALAAFDPLTLDLKKAMQMGLTKIEWNPPPPRDLERLVHETCGEWGD